ncbi:AMP-binding protein [Nannocystis pusilla]|nr:AMP-binding protein [Nannocystis pusilla]
MTTISFVRAGAALSLGPGLGVHPERQAVPIAPGRRAAPAPGLHDALRERARAAPEATAFYFIDTDERLSTLTNAALLAHARAAAGALARRGVGSGARVLLSFATGPDVVVALFGCVLLGAVPILLEPPFASKRALSWRSRAAAILRGAGARALIVEASLHEQAETVARGAAAPPVLVPADLAGSDDFDDEPAPAPDALAFIQYTSGTTSEPRGVMVSHRALLANARGIGEISGYREGELSLGWLPLHHDMGLVGVVLAPFLHGLPVALLPPLSFVLRPQRWLWAMHHLRGALSPAPNFAYQLCLGKIGDDQLAGLDLGAWRLAYNGAEFIDAGTVAAFRRRFGPYGLPARSVHPVYGMAEFVLAATFPAADSEPRVDFVARERLNRDGVAAPVAPDDPAALAFVGVGRPFPGHAMKIVDAAGVALPERVQGQIVLRGPSLTEGYVGDPDASAAALRDGWLCTGDLGYVADGELFVTGRCKELVVKAGRNYHPQALEAAAGRVPGARAGCIAAFGEYDPADGTEAVVVVVETAETGRDALARLARAVERAVLAETGLRPDRVVLVAPRSLPKTSSGKLQRLEIRDLTRADRLRDLMPRDA